MYDDRYVINWKQLLEGMKVYNKIGIIVSIILIYIFIFGNKMLLPDQYESTALVRVKTINSELAREDGRSNRERIVQEELLSRQVLEKVIKNLHVESTDYKKSFLQQIVEIVTGRETKMKEISMDAMVRDLRKEIMIVEVDSNSGGGTNVFSVTMRGKDPKVIANIVNSVVNKYVEGKTDAKILDAEQAIRFLTKQVEDNQANLNVAMKKLNLYRSQNTKFLLSENEVSSSLQDAKMRLIEAQSVLTQKNDLIVSLKEALKSESPVVVGENNSVMINPHERLLQLESHLATLNTKFFPEHPEIKSTIAEINSLRDRIESGKATPNRVSFAGGRTNPEFQRIRSDLATAMSEAKAAKQQIGLIKEEIDDLNEKLKNIPKVSQTLSILDGNKEKAESEYNNSKDRLTSESIELAILKTSVGTNFSIVDPAIESTTPMIRSRLVLYVAGIIFSVGAGIAISLFLGYTFPRQYVPSSKVHNIMFYSVSVMIYFFIILYIVVDFIQQLIVIV